MSRCARRSDDTEASSFDPTDARKPVPAPAQPGAINFDGTGRRTAWEPSSLNPYRSGLEGLITPAAVAREALAPAPAASPAARHALARRAASRQPYENAEDAAFWTSWALFDAAFVADFVTTGMVLSRGGYEEDPLYTAFGNTNMAGVIGSAVAVHAVSMLATLGLHAWARRTRGPARAILDVLAGGGNTYGIAAHTAGFVNNVGVLNQ
jgi:hypothetical protein